MKKIKQLLAVFFAAVLMFTALPVSSVAVMSEQIASYSMSDTGTTESIDNSGTESERSFSSVPITEPVLMQSLDESSGTLFEKPVTAGGVAEYTLGDVDGSGQVSSADARLTLRAAVGLETLDARQTLAADVNGDGNIRSADARLILRVAVGLPSFDEE